MLFPVVPILHPFARPQMANSTVGYAPEQFEIPTDFTFSLADSTSVRGVESTTGLSVYLGAAGADLSSAETPFATLKFLERTLRTSLHGVVNDDRAQHLPVFSLSLSSPKSELSPKDAWAVLYALWIRRPSEDVVPVSLDTESIANVEDLLIYLTHTGLAFSPPDATAPTDLLVSRLAFWQGAGAPLERSWHRAPIPHPSLSGLAPFGFTPSFTRATNVCTVHPLRPPKPAPGTIIYSRYIFAVNQTLTFIHINANDPLQFETYCRWQNSDRVNHGWREKGDDEHHRKYIEEKLRDKHSMGFLVAWDGEFAGYGECGWVKEDHMGTFVGGLGDYDQGMLLGLLLLLRLTTILTMSSAGQGLTSSSANRSSGVIRAVRLIHTSSSP